MHKGIRHKCSECEFTSGRKGDLNKHMKKVRVKIGVGVWVYRFVSGCECVYLCGCVCLGALFSERLRGN